MRQRKASTKPNVDSGFPQIRPNAAGLDIGSREHFVAGVPIRGSFLAAWL